MKIIHRDPDVKYHHLHTRSRQAFLWLPKSIDGDWRWLEYAKWEERGSGFSGFWGEKWL